MKPSVCLAFVAALMSTPAGAAPESISFSLTVSPGASSCLPNANGIVLVHSFGDFENMEVLIQGLPASTDFDLFIIQVPNAPFGASWYMGDIKTDTTGVGVGNFVGRFNKETFIISPGATPAPNTFPDPPAHVPENTAGILTNPIQMYHLGVWFDSTAAAGMAGCPITATPFNGVHNAGIQVLNTANFGNLTGPLLQLQ
jgi:hypothetical protein